MTGVQTCALPISRCLVEWMSKGKAVEVDIYPESELRMFSNLRLFSIK